MWLFFLVTLCTYSFFRMASEAELQCDLWSSSMKRCLFIQGKRRVAVTYLERPLYMWVENNGGAISESLSASADYHHGTTLIL